VLFASVLNTGETKVNQQRNRSYRGRNVIGRARFLAVFLELCTRVALVAHAFRLVAPCAASRFVCGFVPIVYVTVSSMRRLERVSRAIEWYVKMCRFQWKRMKSEGHAAGLSLCVSFAFQSRPMLLCRIRIPMKALSAVAGGARTRCVNALPTREIHEFRIYRRKKSMNQRFYRPEETMN